MDITTDEIGNGNRLERLFQTMHSYWTIPTLERSALDATRHQGYWMLKAPGILDATGTGDTGCHMHQGYWMER